MNKTHLELRILTYLECEEKMKIISRIINFLHENNFSIDLGMVYYNVLRAENIPEQQDVASLTIDMRDEKFRFKFWDGSKIYWTYHLEDLFNTLIDGRKEFLTLVEKYRPITNLLFALENKNIKNIRYQYYPSDNTDIIYSITFVKEAETKNVANFIIKDIFEQINSLNIEDLKMDIDYSFEKECIPCQKRKEKENENMGR